MTRDALVRHFAGLRTDWSANVVATNSAGYVARSREWGLVRPAMHEGRYLLTEFGERLRDEIGGDR
jgi:hypothetical protein